MSLFEHWLLVGKHLVKIPLIVDQQQVLKRYFAMNWMFSSKQDIDHNALHNQSAILWLMIKEQYKVRDVVLFVGCCFLFCEAHLAVFCTNKVISIITFLFIWYDTITFIKLYLL